MKNEMVEVMVMVVMEWIWDTNQKINLIKSRLTYKKDDDILNSINSRLKEALQENLK